MLALIIDQKHTNESVAVKGGSTGVSHFVTCTLRCDDLPPGSTNQLMVSKELFDALKVGDRLELKLSPRS